MYKTKWERRQQLAIMMAMVSSMGALTACATVETKVVYQDRLAYPDDALLRDCDVTAPPAKADYLHQAADPVKTGEECDKKLTDYGNAQTNNLVNCNVRLKAMRKEKADLKAKLTPKPSVSPKE